MELIAGLIVSLACLFALKKYKKAFLSGIIIYIIGYFFIAIANSPEDATLNINKGSITNTLAHATAAFIISYAIAALLYAVITLISRLTHKPLETQEPNKNETSPVLHQVKKPISINKPIPEQTTAKLSWPKRSKQAGIIGAIIFICLLSVTLLFTVYNSKTENVIYQRSSSKTPTTVFLNLNTQSIKGQVKPLQLNNKVYLSFRLVHKYDTSSNLKLKRFFLGKPIDYGNYTDNYDTVFKQVYNERKQEIERDGLTIEEIENPKKHQNMEAFIYQGYLDTSSIKEKVNTIIERRKIARQRQTFPIFYDDNPYIKTRTPSFDVTYQIKFLDNDDFELISYQTEHFTIRPFFDNILQGKVEVGYNDVAKFKKEIFDKADKIIVTVITAN